MRLIPSAVLIFALLCPVPRLIAEKDRASTATFTARTSLVLVPVVVSDKQGNHVSGLAATDFELRQDGKGQPIANFEEITSETTAAQVPAVPSNAFTNEVVAPHPKNLLIIVMDLPNTSYVNQKYAREGLIDFLSKSVNEDALFALVVFRPNGVQLIHSFTRDRSVLISAIRKVQAEPSLTDKSSLTVSGDDDVEAAQIDAFLAGDLGSVAARVDFARQGQASLVTLESFQQVGRYFASVPGRKSLLWASSAFQFGTGDFSVSGMLGVTEDDWQRTVRMLQDANIAVYPVDVAGLTGSVFRGAGSSVPNTSGSIPERTAVLAGISEGRYLDPADAKHITMQVVADRTGGRPYYNSNDVSKMLHQATLDSRQYYMLAFYSKGSDKPGWHKVQVKCRRDGPELRYRSGFFVTKDMANPEMVRQQDEFHAVSSYLNFTSLPIHGMWQQIEPAGNVRKVHFSLNLAPGVSTIDTDHENHIDMDFLAVAMDTNGKEAANINQRLSRNLPPPGVAQIQTNGLTYANTLTLPPGEYRVHVAVRDNLSGKIGSVVAPLKVE